MAHDHDPIAPSSLADRSDPNVSKISLFGLLGILLTYVLILYVQVLYYALERTEAERKEIKVRPPELQRLLVIEHNRLAGKPVQQVALDGTVNTVEWNDINSAMQQVTTRYQQPTTQPARG